MCTALTQRGSWSDDAREEAEDMYIFIYTYVYMYVYIIYVHIVIHLCIEVADNSVSIVLPKALVQ